MVQTYGFANRCLSEVTAQMIGNEDLCKFLYYTQGGENDKFLEKEIFTQEEEFLIFYTEVELMSALGL